MADDASTKPTRPPYGWEEKTDDDGKIHWTSAAGTQVYTMPEEPVYVTHEKVQEWVKLYDARSGKFYFSNSFTGEHGVDTPPLYFKQLKDKLPFPKFLVSALIIQRVARIRRANVRVNCKRAEMHQKFAGAHARYIKTFHPHHHTYYWCNPKEKKYTWEQPQPKDEYDFSIKDKNRAKYPKWFRLWDPSHKQHYYHDTFEGTFQYTQPPEWNAIMWAFGFRSGYPPLLKAALTTQTLYRRKTVARKIETNGQMLENMSTAERRKYMEKKAEELAKRKREMVIRREHEKEANDRAGLAHEEALQRVRGDKFWGLDVAAQAQILDLLRKLQKDFGLTYLFISHDLGVVQHMSDSIAVMYVGKVVEHADRLNLFQAPRHPYTQALLSAVPTVNCAKRAQQKRILIPGDPPDPVNLSAGCRFANRCPVAEAICQTIEPELKPDTNDHCTACHLL